MSPATTLRPRQAQPDSSGGAGVIQCTDLSRRFGSKQALREFTASIGPGRITGLLGPNGSGKSTLMRCLTGLVRPDSGTAQVDGLPVRGDGADVRARLTYAPGELHLYGEMRGAEHLDWLLRGREAAARGRARDLAREFDLPLDQRVRGYSHGMKRQLCFAAAMAPDVPVRILDEVTDGLDPTRRGHVLDALRADADRGTTILLSSHHLGEVDRACDRMLFMNEGLQIADESPESVRERTARLVRLTYEQPLDETLASRLSGPWAESVTSAGKKVTVLVSERDPRPFLAVLAKHDELPQPERIEYGCVSLAELYEDLYGVEGV